MTESKVSVRLGDFFKAILGPGFGAQALKNTTQEFVVEVAALEDDYHTQEELYESRLFLNAHLFTLWSRLGIYPVVKSWRHHDGEPCFDGEYFIVVATLPYGQVSFHYKKEHWDKFQIPSVEFGPKWDGHTTKDAHDRLNQALPMVGIKVLESHTEWIKR